MVIAFERLINMNRIYETCQNVAIKHTFLILLACVVISLLSSASFAVATAYDQYISFQMGNQIVIFTGIILIFLLYTILYRRVVRHVVETIRLQSTGIVGNNETQNRPAHLLSTARVAKRIVTALCIPGMPYAIFELYRTFGINTRRLKHTSWISFGYWLATVLLYFNSTMNAVIFILGNRKSKRFLKSIWQKRRRSMTQNGP